MCVVWSRGRPGPRALQDTELADLLARQRFGALATQKSSGRPHLSTVAYTWDPERQVVRISTIADRLKVRQLQRDPHGALYVASDDFRSYAVAEGEAELSPVSTEPGDEAASNSSPCSRTPPGTKRHFSGRWCTTGG